MASKTEAVNGAPPESRLKFATEVKPELPTDVEGVKATLAAGGLENRMLGKIRDDAYYTLIATCGGAIETREAILDRVVPQGHLQPLNFQFYAGWDDPVEWQVLSFGTNGIWKPLATGNITDDCEVITD